MIIGLSGKQQAGKDTAAGYLVNTYGFKRYAFADRLKEVATKYLGCGHDKHDPLVRQFWKTLGTDVVRRYDPDFWIRHVERQIRRDVKRGHDYFVITDVRFVNEAEWIRSLRGVVIRVHRTGHVVEDQHATETEMDGYQFDHVVTNQSGDFNTLFGALDEVIGKLKMEHHDG